MNSRAYGQLLILGALWGAAFMFMRIAAPEFGAFATAGARVTLACVMMIVCVIAMKQSIHLRTHWKKYIVIGGVNTAIPFIAYCFAALYIPSAYSAIANSTTPIWGALIAWLWFKEDLPWTKWLGIVLAFAGVIALVGLQPVAITPMVIAGVVACLIGAMMYATASFLIKRYLTDAGGLAGSTGMVWGAFMWLIIPAIIAAPAQMPSLKAWGAVAALAVFCTVIGYILFFHLIDQIGPQRASSVAFLFPAFAAFWGWLFIDEPITMNMLLGMGLVLFGTALVSATGGAAGQFQANCSKAWQYIGLPFIIGLSPEILRKRLVRRAIENANLYASETNATISAISQNRPELRCSDLARSYRLCRLADLSDFWISRLSFRKRRKFEVDIDPGLNFDARALWVTFHYGGGWWITSFLRERRLTAYLLIRKPEIEGNAIERLIARLGIYRNQFFSRLVQAPLIWSNASGAALKLRSAWRDGKSAIALLDLPVQPGERYMDVSFFGQNARFPSAVFSLAEKSRVPIYLFVGSWNPETLRPILAIKSLAEVGQSAEESMRRYVSELETLIEFNPSSWHFWPSVESYRNQAN
jgi:drug/metabolite transporter (DMT)-like permease